MRAATASTSDQSEIRPPAEPPERVLLRARDGEMGDLMRADPHAGLDACKRWLAESEPGSEAHAWALRACAHAARWVGDNAASNDYYEQAEAAFKQLGLPVEVARTGVGHVWTLRLLGRYDEAVRLGVRERNFLLSQGDSLAAAKLTLNLGTVYRRTSRLDRARQAYLDAARDFRAAGDLTMQATAFSNLGNVLGDMGRYDEAERAERRAIRLYTQLQQWAEVARATVHLGLLLRRRGDYGGALTVLQDGRAMFEKLDLVGGVADADLNLAQTYLHLNLQQEAADAARRARDGFEQVSMPQELGQSLFWSAVVADRQGDTAEAVKYLAASVEIFRQIGNRLWGEVASVLAASISEPSEASIHTVAESEQRLARLGARDRAIEARLVRADLLRRLGRNREALARYRAAVRSLRGLGDEQLEYRASAALGQMLELSSPGRALAHYRAAMDHLDTLRRLARADDLKLSFVADKLDVYERTASILLRSSSSQHRVAEALAIVEQGKSLGLLDDLLTQAERGGRETAALARRLRDLRARLSDAYARRDELESGELGRTVADSAEETDLARLEQEVAAATRDLQLAVRGSGVAAPFDLDKLREALPTGAVLLEYYSLDSELVCFVVDNQRVRLRRGFGSLAEAQQLANRLRFQFGMGVYGAAYLEANLPTLRRRLDRVLAAMSQQLLAPLRADLRSAQQVIVVPHGPLHGLPLHAAFDGESYLSDRLIVSFAPSARVFTACTQRNNDPPSNPLFVGPRNERLPWVAREVQTLSQIFPESETLTGRRATLKSLRRRAGGFDLLHLAAHGQFRADNPQFSAIQLSDGWLNVGDLAELCHGTSLVTLSACETGLNSVEAGEELVGLTRAVLGAGAASLLASLWTVHDEATSRLMTAFYSELQRGQSKAASLQLAMQQVKQDLDHPYFWAPFALAGAV